MEKWEGNGNSFRLLKKLISVLKKEIAFYRVDVLFLGLQFKNDCRFLNFCKEVMLSSGDAVSLLLFCS